MRSYVPKVFTLFLICLMTAVLSIPAAADVVVTPWDYIAYTPIGAILAAILVAAVIIVTVLLIRRFFGKKQDDHNDPSDK